MDAPLPGIGLRIAEEEKAPIVTIMKAEYRSGTNVATFMLNTPTHTCPSATSYNIKPMQYRNVSMAFDSHFYVRKSSVLLSEFYFYLGFEVLCLVLDFT